MKYLINLVFVLLLFSAVSNAQESAADKMASAVKRVIDDRQSVGIAAGVISDTATWYYGAGYRDFATKEQFTVATMQLVEQGKLSLDDPIGKYIPEIKNKKLLNAAVKHLLHQTSGIKAYKNKKEAQNTTDYPTHLDAAKLFMSRKLLFEPGQGFRYSTYNYTLLSIILERASGQAYEAYMKEHIFEVTGMSSTSVEVFGDYPAGKSSIYNENNGAFVQVTDSTVHDVLLFAKAVSENQLISIESFNLMIQDSGMKKKGNPYGMGWFLYGESQNSGPIIGHTGGQIGCTAMLIIIPGADAATVVITNVAGVASVNQIANDLFSVVAELKNER